MSQDSEQTGRDVGLQESASGFSEAVSEMLLLDKDARFQVESDHRLHSVKEFRGCKGRSEGVKSGCFSSMEAAIGLLPVGVG